MKSIITILILLLGTNHLFGQESSSNKKWYIYLQGGRGQIQNDNRDAPLGSRKLGLEYRINPWIGLGAGISGSRIHPEEGGRKGERDHSPNPLLLLWVLSQSNFMNQWNGINSNSQQTENLILLGYLVGNKFRDKEGPQFNYRTVSLDFNFHMNKDNTFDPYIGVSALAGRCGRESDCRVLGAEARLGLQVNFETFFTYIQAGTQTLKFQGEHGGSEKAQSIIGSLGVGVRF